MHCHTFRFSCSKPAPLTRWTTVVCTECQQSEVFESAGGTPEDSPWGCDGITTTDRKNLDNLIRRTSSVLESPLDFLEVMAQWRRTKLSLLVNDKHCDNTGELHQWQATSLARVKEVLPSCSHQQRSSYATDSVHSQHLTSALCTQYNNALFLGVKPSSHREILQGIQGYVQY